VESFPLAFRVDPAPCSIDCPKERRLARDVTTHIAKRAAKANLQKKTRKRDCPRIAGPDERKQRLCANLKTRPLIDLDKGGSGRVVRQPQDGSVGSTIRKRVGKLGMGEAFRALERIASSFRAFPHGENSNRLKYNNKSKESCVMFTLVATDGVHVSLKIRGGAGSHSLLAFARAVCRPTYLGACRLTVRR